MTWPCVCVVVVVSIGNVTRSFVVEDTDFAFDVVAISGRSSMMDARCGALYYYALVCRPMRSGRSFAEGTWGSGGGIDGWEEL